MIHDHELRELATQAEALEGGVLGLCAVTHERERGGRLDAQLADLLARAELLTDALRRAAVPVAAGAGPLGLPPVTA